MTPERTGADRVHAPLERYAQARRSGRALCDGERSWSWDALASQVRDRAAALGSAPSTLCVDPDAGVADQLLQFLAVVASGRCAAMIDAGWPALVRQAVDGLLANDGWSRPQVPTADDPFYVGFTSGSSGVPKGFRRSHASWTASFRACLDAFGDDAAGPVLAPGAPSHSLFLFGMLLGLWTGGGTVVQDRFHAARTLDQLRDGAARVLVAVPTQLQLMLELAARRGRAPIPGLRLVLMGGARWPREATPALQALFPQARLVEFYGASETSFVSWQDVRADTPPEVVGRPFADVALRIGAAGDDCGPSSPGLIYVRSPMLFRDYLGAVDPATAAVRDGEWLSVRDLGWLDGQGRLCLAGRQQRMVVTHGHNVFPDEIETVLQRHPAVARAAVLDQPDALRDRRLVAVLQWAESLAPEARPNAGALARWCREHLEPHKLPRRWWLCTAEWPWTASGKTDLPTLRQALERAEAGDTAAEPPRLLPLV